MILTKNIVITLTNYPQLIEFLHPGQKSPQKILIQQTTTHKIINPHIIYTMQNTDVLFSILTLLLLLTITTNAQNIFPCSIPNCQVCTYFNFCGLCDQGYLLYIPPDTGQPQCQDIVCDVQDCQYCLLANVCEECAEGFVGTVDGGCEAPGKKYRECQPSNNYCLVCGDGSQPGCLRCMYGYILLQNKTCVTATPNRLCQVPGSTPSTCSLCYSPSTPNLAINPAYLCQSYEPGLFCPSGCLQCYISTLCVTCVSGYLYNSTTSLCQINPIPNCQQYTDANICNQCSDGFVLVNNTCIQAAYGCAIDHCILCNGLNQCWLCQTNYLQYDTGIFIICLPPQKVNQLTSPMLMVQNCQIYQTYNSLNNLIQLPQQRYIKYSPLCSQCQPGMIMIGGICLPQIANYTCQVANCVRCIFDNYCGECADGYRVDGGVCLFMYSPIEGCLISTLFFSGALICQLCKQSYIKIFFSCQPMPNIVCSIPGCQYCLANNTCAQCVTGSQLHIDTNQTTTCISTCYDTNCFSCQNVTQCIFCNIGYLLNTTTMGCVPISVFCPAAYIGCLECDDRSGCVKCAVGYALVYGECCPVQNVSIAGCLLMSGCYSECLECYPGYFRLNDGKCLALPCDIENCVYCFGSSTCIVCAEGYSLDPDRNLCVNNAVFLSCRTPQNPYCTSCTNSTCLSCDYYTTLIGNQCYCNIPGCLRCMGNSLCIQCAYPLFPNFVEGGGCGPMPIPNSACLVQNCNFCNQPTMCAICSQGYSLNKQNTCKLNNCSSLSNCVLCNPAQTICYACQASYSLTSIAGQKCISLPKNYTCNVVNCALCSLEDRHQCTECIQMYTLQDPGTCVRINCPSDCIYCIQSKTCIVCNDATFLNSNFTCQAVQLLPWYFCSQPNCVQCFANGKCTLCLPGYQPDQEGYCRIQHCQALNCRVCLPTSVSNLCMICQQGFFLNSYQQCIRYSPAPLTPSCSVTNCMYCYYDDKCSLCFPGYQVQKNLCVMDSGCLDLNCDFCLSPYVCAICRSGYTLYKGRCTNFFLLIGIMIPMTAILFGIAMYCISKKIKVNTQKTQPTYTIQLTDMTSQKKSTQKDPINIQLNESNSHKQAFNNYDTSSPVYKEQIL